MEYGRIVKRALSITWHHKVLWIFGVAAALFGASHGWRGSVPQGNSVQWVLGRGDIARLQHATPWWPGAPWTFFNYLRTAFPLMIALLAFALIVVLVMCIVGIVVRYTSLGALAGMVDEVEESERTSFNSGLRKGLSRMLRLFAIDLLIGIGVFIIMIPFIVLIMLGVFFAIGPAIALASVGKAMSILGILWGVGVGLGVVLLIIIVAVALSALVTLTRELAFRACVLDKRGVFDALRAAFALVRTRTREVVLMWLLLLGINLAISLLTIPLALTAVGGLVGPAFLVFNATRSVPVAIVAALPFVLVIAFAGVVISGVYLTFRSAVWTLSYRELHGKQVIA
jgi:hypothetical protein